VALIKIQLFGNQCQKCCKPKVSFLRPSAISHEVSALLIEGRVELEETRVAESASSAKQSQLFDAAVAKF
jgi:hypothetical protein